MTKLQIPPELFCYVTAAPGDKAASKPLVYTLTQKVRILCTWPLMELVCMQIVCMVIQYPNLNPPQVLLFSTLILMLCRISPPARLFVDGMVLF